MSETSVRAVAFAVTAMVFVGSSAAVSRALTAAPLCTAQAVRYALAAVILVVLARLLRIPVVRPRGAEWLWLAGTSVSGLVLFNIAVVRGVTRAQPAMIAVAVACVPVLLGVLGPMLQRQSPHRRIVLAAVVVTAGAAGVEGAGHADAAGAAWAVLALVCEAGFTLLAVPVLGRHGAWGVSVHMVWMGAVMFGVLGLAGEGPSAVTRLTVTDVLAVTYLALLVTVAAFLLWYTAVSALGPGRAGLMTGVAPVSAALAGLVLGTRAPNLLMWLGIAVVAAGLAFGLWSRPPYSSRKASAVAASSDDKRGQLDRVPLACRVEDEVATEVQQDVIGGEELQAREGGLRDEEPVEGVVPDEFGECADSLGVLGGDAQEFQALFGESLAEVVGHAQLAEHALDVQFPHGGCGDMDSLPGSRQRIVRRAFR